MNLLLVVLQQHAEEAAAEPNVFGLSASVSFWTVVIFLLLLGVLMKFAFPPILGYAAAREKRIQDSLDESKRLRAEAESFLAQQREELQEARRQSQQIVAESRQAGERLKQDILEQARAHQQELVARAKQEIERDRERALEALRREAVDLALAAASRLLERRLSSEEDRALVADYLGRVKPRAEPAGVA
ncbi:MAG: F0F1 ATP synthase subunit B [Longimicrobiales bacterium]